MHCHWHCHIGCHFRWRSSPLATASSQEDQVGRGLFVQQNMMVGDTYGKIWTDTQNEILHDLDKCLRMLKIFRLVDFRLFDDIRWDGTIGKGLANVKTETDVLGPFVSFLSPVVGEIASHNSSGWKTKQPQYACYQLDDNYCYS